MTTTEHLQLIKSECERLLAIAEKRTQGEWYVSQYHTTVYARGNRSSQIAINEYQPDCAYIAACAGRAEAGWRSTIAAIDCIEEFERNGFIAHSWLDMTDKLIATWPIELLTQ